MNVKSPSFDEVEELKRQWTEKHVQVDESRPELKRFAGRTGRVITVNMSGRALVQFEEADGWGWGRYDIALPFLRQVAAPAAPTKEKAEKHVAAEQSKPETATAKPAAKLSPLEMMRAKAASKPAQEGAAPAESTAADKPKPTGKLSPIEMMRAKAAAKAAVGEATAAEPAASEPKPGGKMSPLEMIRAKAAAKSEGPTPPPAEAPATGVKPAGKQSPLDMIRAKAAQKKSAEPTTPGAPAPEAEPLHTAGAPPKPAGLSPLELIRQKAAQKKAEAGE